MNVAALAPDLFKIAEAADLLEAYLGRNAGPTADWPIALTVRGGPMNDDEATANELSDRLNALKAALVPYRSAVESAEATRRTLLKIAGSLERRPSPKP